jgi:ABC-type amino acid transport substrate-binding protein
MKMKLKYFAAAIIASISTLVFWGATQIHLSASEILFQTHNQIVAQLENSQDQIIFGYSEDSYPVSSKEGIFISGYCGELEKYLKGQGFDLEPVAMQYSQRFKAFEGVEESVIKNKQPAVECGPNTKTMQRKEELEKLTDEKSVDSKFSSTFFTSTAKLLIDKSKIRELSENSENIKIGVLGSTTTQVIGQIYPTSPIVSIDNRNDAIEKLERGGMDGGIDAYASDEILLLGIRNDKNFKRRREFSIEPKIYGFTREEYGIVIYNDDALRDKINNWIDKDGKKAKNNLRKQVFMSSALSSFIENAYFYPLLLGVVIACVLLIVSHPFFIFLLLKLMPSKQVNRFLDWLKVRKMKKGENDLVVVFTNQLLNNEVFTVVAHRANDKFKIGFLDSDAAIKLVEELGIKPLLQKYREDGLTQETAEEKVVEVIAQKADSDYQIYKMLQTWVDAAGTTAVTEIVKRVLGQTGN